MFKLSMNKFVAMTFLIFFTSQPQTCSSRKVLMLKGNMFQKLNVVIQSMVNKIFSTLKLNKNFTLEYKHRLLLSMHASMKSIAEENFRLYKSIKRICRFNQTKRPKEGLFNLDKLIEVVVDDHLNPSVDNSKNNTKRAGLKLKITSLEIPAKSEETIVFLREYLNNVENMQLVGFETPSQRIKEMYEKNAKIRVIKRKNLKAWKAPNGTELAKPANRRLFQGLNTKITKFPFVASIHVMGDFVCTGSVISADMVITAGTCMQVAFSDPKILESHPKSIVVRVGSEFTDRHGELCYVSKVFLHPSFDPVTLRNNLAIVKIKKRLNFRKKNKKIRRIVFRKKDDMLMENAKEVMLLGWGEKQDQTAGANPLSYSNLDIYSIEKCTTTYSKRYVTNMNYCAGFSSKGSGACQRDVGGPAILNSTLVGVVSFGPPICGTPDAPTVFTDIKYYTDWIESVIKGIPSKTKLKKPNKVLTKLKKKIEQQLRKIKPELQMKMRSGNKKHLMNKEGEIPQAMQVISYLLNKLIGGNLRLDSDDDDEDDSSDENNDTNNDTETTDKPTTEETTTTKTYYNKNVVRNVPDTTTSSASDPEPLYDDRHFLITSPKPDTDIIDGTGANRQGPDHEPQKAIEKLNENIQFQNYTGLTERLIIGAVRILREYLGLNVSVTPMDENADNSAIVMDSSGDQLGKSNIQYLNKMMSGEDHDDTLRHVVRYKESETEESKEKNKDASTSEEGISIELPPRTTVSSSRYPSLFFSRTTTLKSVTKFNSEEPLAGLGKEGSDLMSEEEEKKFLSKNFKPDNPPLNMLDEDDLVVLLLQDKITTRRWRTTTTKRPYHDFGLLATQYMSEDDERKTVADSDDEATDAPQLRNNMEPSTLMSTFKMLNTSTTEKPDEDDDDDDDEDDEKDGRRHILDYINIT